MSQPHLSRRTVLKAGVGLATAGLVGGIVGSEGIEVVRREIRLPKWDADGFRVAQISDIHLNSDGLLARAKEAVRLAVEAKPDLFVFTGDFLNRADPESLARVVPAFEPLHDFKGPCLAIFGNHDYDKGNDRELLRVLPQTRLRLLRNEVAEVDGVSVGGIDDGIFMQHRPEVLNTPKLSRSLLVLFHEPDYVDLVPDHVSLQLSGHSHGGEVCLPGGIPIHTPVGALKYKKGYYPDAHAPLFVSKGVGTLAPARVFCPPDVAILTLRSA